MPKELTPVQQAKYRELQARVKATYQAFQSSGNVSARRRDQLAKRWLAANNALDAFVKKHM